MGRFRGNGREDDEAVPFDHGPSHGVHEPWRPKPDACTTQAADSCMRAVMNDGRVIRVEKRPTWRASEGTTKDVFETESGEQYSFQDGKRVATGSKGSVRPDLYCEGRSIEVKNYLISTPKRRDRLVSVITKQARKRAKELPPGTRQLVRLDLRGQLLSTGDIVALASAIEHRSGGIIRRQDVHWILSLYPVDD
jgi:hypothetical protein